MILSLCFSSLLYRGLSPKKARMFTFFKERMVRKENAISLYRAAVKQSRQPAFYKKYAVPDTVDGRYEMTALHCYLLMRRLYTADNDKLAQKLFDIFFVRMDKTLREMGVGDLSIPKHMKRMMQGFNGRANGYETALKAQDSIALKETLLRNVYGTIDAPDMAGVALMVEYVMRSAAIETIENIEAPAFAMVEGLVKKEEKRCA